MINLLPPAEKNNLELEKKYRLFSILFTFILFFLVSSSLILFSLKVYLAGQVASQRIFVEIVEEQFEGSQIQNLEEDINLINQNLSRLNSFYEKQPNFTDLLENISKIIPDEIYLNTLSLNPIPQEEKKLKASLGGYCSTRETLSEFKKILEAEANFREVYFPPANWMKSADIDFNATFEIII